jgi:pyruvate/2-oxoglutarate dehydrogenase complex dihydrolipoamide acyltransferase (E2) component
VSGSGPHGRIVKQDVLDFVSKPTSAKKVSDESTIVKTATAGQTGHRAAHGQRIEFTGWRKVIADRMLRSKTEIPHYTMNIEIDVTDLDRLIQRLRETEGKKITYLPFMMKALEQGIGEAPEVNAFCDGKGFSMMQEINMGLAVDLGQKLLVPVVHDVQSKSVLQLFDELGPLINKAREDRLDPADVEGGTMTLTNVGMFKIHSANSVIVQPQVTIIYMGTAREVPAVHEGHIEIRKRMICGATFDHRVVNGAQGGRFLVKVKEYLEDMGRFVMHIR